MGSQLSATMFAQVYEDLGIDPGKLGCIMIDTAVIKVSDVIAEEDLYYADPEKHKWIQGVVSEEVPHVTLLYGLLRSGKELQKHVDAILTGWKPEALVIKEVSFFYSNDPGEDYVTLVALIEPTENLVEGNARLAMLPHMNTFTSYMPHVTLAYAKGESDWKQYVDTLNTKLKGQTVEAVGLNYGG